MGSVLLTFEELSTLLVQIEACLNSRPLYPLTEDPNDLQPLTPGHFLIGAPLTAPPDDHITRLHPTNRWKMVQRVVAEFWKRWSQEYCSHLQGRGKWPSSTPNLQKGAMVLVKDERYPPQQWPLGRVMELHPGLDHLVRVVTVKTAAGIIKRPIVKICPLPIQENTMC